MNLKERRKAARRQELAKSQGNAQMIHSILQGEKTPRDAVATLCAVHAAMIWTLEQHDEDEARRIATEHVDGIVELWRVNRDFVRKQEAERGN